MRTLPVAIAQKLLLLQQNQKLPFSSIRHPITSELLQEGIVQKLMQGRGKAYLVLPFPQALTHYLHNHFGIADLQAYVHAVGNANTTRQQAVQTSANSKVKRIRSFTGFMVATLQPIEVMLHNEAFTLAPHSRIFTYVADFAHFAIPGDVTIIGVENGANFLNLHSQSHLFAGYKALFVCRYPYSSDLLQWLQQIPNAYTHFGDFDFAGIQLYLAEYWKHLPDRASFFVPDNLDELLGKYGNRNLYNHQQLLQLVPDHGAYNELQPVIDLLHKHKKGLEQEILIAEPGTL